MNKFNHAATDKKLGTQIDKHNDKLEPHQATAAAIQKPPDVSDDECATLDVGTIATHRAGLLSERLKWEQDDVRLKREQCELLEAIESEVKARADAADKNYDDVHQKVAAKLEKAGLGLDAQRADRHSRAAARQFEQSVLQSVDVRQAVIEKRHARGQVGHAVQLTHQAKSDLQDAIQALRQFVHNQLKGSHHGHTQVPNAGRKTAHAKHRSAV